MSSGPFKSAMSPSSPTSMSTLSSSSSSSLPTLSEQRRSRRISRSVDVEISDKHGRRRGRAIDVSRHGLFVAVVDPPHNRHLVQLIIHLPDGPMPAAATVSRTLPGQGVGLSLFALSSEAKRRWDAFILLAQQEQPSSSSSSLPMTTMLPAPVGRRQPDVPSFVVKLKTIERLKDYLQAHVAVGGTVLFTPVLPPAGSAVSLLVVHPQTEAEFPLNGRVHKAIAIAPKRLEIVFNRTDVVAFARFVETGLAPTLLALLPTSAPPTDLSQLAGPTATELCAQVARELEFEIEEDTSMQDDPIDWNLNASDLPVLVGQINSDLDDVTARGASDVQLSIIAGDGDGDDSDGDGDNTATGRSGLDDIHSEELVIDDTRPAADPGLRPRSLRVDCNNDECKSDPYTLELGPCSGVLGLVADLMPFFSPENERVVSVPRLVPAEIRRERFHDYVQRNGQIDDLVVLSTFLAAADLAELPRHPMTADLLRASRGIEQLAEAFELARFPLTSKIRCPRCNTGFLVVE